jgi:hypothetical protein
VDGKLDCRFHVYISVNWCVFDSKCILPPRGWARCGEDGISGGSKPFLKAVRAAIPDGVVMMVSRSCMQGAHCTVCRGEIVVGVVSTPCASQYCGAFARGTT